MIERVGSTADLVLGSYTKSAKGTIYRVDAVHGTTLTVTNAAGESRTMELPQPPRPCTILEPTEQEALAILQRTLGAEVEAVRTDRAEGFRCVPMGNDTAKWHTHMFLMHGIWTKTGPGSRSLPKIKEAHEQDHLDAAEGRPTGAYVKHRH